LTRVYPIKHRGCAIICGAAPSLFDDLKAAKELRPDATILGVKFAASLVPDIWHVWTQHGEMTLDIKKSVNRKIYVHARPRMIQTAKGTKLYIPHSKESYEAIDYVWPELDYAKGSSGIAGALWARHGMGFDEVIMAGIGLSYGDKTYASGYPNKYQCGNAYANNGQIENWLRLLHKHVEDRRTNGIFSMSGKTREILGSPCKN
jgi:hypothetical protein